MAQEIKLKIAGLYTNPNPLSEVPDGGLAVADNIVIDKESIAECRRGMTKYGNDIVADTLLGVQKIFSFREKILFNFRYDVTPTWKMAYDTNDAGTWASYTGTYAPPASDYRMHSVEANRSFFFTTSAGIYKLESPTSTPAQAGMYKGLDGNTSLTGTSGCMGINKACAYRMVWCKYDANNYLVTGAPSQMVYAINEASLYSAKTMASATDIDHTNDLFTSVGHGYITGVKGQFTTSTTLPAGLSLLTDYYAIRISADTFKVAASYADAIAGTPKDITSNGTGNQTFTPVDYTSQNVSLTFTIPSGITTSHFFQIYRSPFTSTASDTPLDDLQLVIEDYPTSGEIAALSFTRTDSTVDALKGAYLYTSSTQEGILQANEPPPYCKDVTIFKDYVFCFNTKQKHRLYLNLISAGFSVDDTVTIAGTIYVAKATETIASLQFQIYSAGTPAENIEDTSLSLIRVINRNSTNTSVYAYYLSGYNDLPGKILIEERGTGGVSFAATASSVLTGDLFSPSLPTTGVTVSSENDEKYHRVHISKLQQPEAFPLLQYLDVGSADQPILRGLALRDAIFIFKDDGIYRIGGDDTSSFRVTLHDGTVKLLAPESAVVFDNKIYCFTDQGVATVGDTGVQIISRPIEHTLLQLIPYTNFATLTWAVAYESERKYILYLPSASTDTYPTQAYVFNNATNSWTRWTGSPIYSNCGLVNVRDNKLYTSRATLDHIKVERKSFTLSDYADETHNMTVVTVESGTSIVVDLLTPYQGAVVGYTFQQGSTSSLITAATDISTGPSPHRWRLTLQNSISLSAGAANSYEPIAMQIEFIPITGGNPSTTKRFIESTFLFSDAGFDHINVGFANNFSPDFEYTSLYAAVYRPWGEFPWGDPSIPWGGTYGGFQPMRTFIPVNTRFGLWMYLRLKLQQAFTNLKFNGCTILFDIINTRIR